ncbi:MAG: HEAT repeat domain-containing protein [Chitinispirillales bacterium]|jgi:hypothetical protein|nr:HEAT repeat domain-containing protein [Chitinispirillales bacterium]
MWIDGRNLARFVVILLAAGLFFVPSAKTRWGTLQLVPSADMIAGDRIVVDADLFWLTDTFSFSQASSFHRVHLGISEWVNFDLGYADGFTMGFKACVLKEGPALYWPTVTIGTQNLYANREAVYFGKGKRGYPHNELYIAAAKSSEELKLRVHTGVITAIDYIIKPDRFNPFVGFEKYIGAGAYVTLEAQRRSAEIIFALFATKRIIRDRLEFSVGVVDLPGMFSDKNRKVIKPGVRAGLKVNIGHGLNSMDGLAGIEDRIDAQRDTLTAFRRELKMLKEESQWNALRIDALSGMPQEHFERRIQVVDELIKLQNLYDQIPFDPEIVKAAIDRIKDQYETYLPHLSVIVTDPKIQLRLRRLAVSLIGETGDRSSSAILVSMLSRFEEPELKIEIMIALGKLKETRSRDALKTLREDSDTAVAFTASEVYRALFGDDEKTDEVIDSVVEEEHLTVPEKRIGQ